MRVDGHRTKGVSGRRERPWAVRCVVVTAAELGAVQELLKLKGKEGGGTMGLCFASRAANVLLSLSGDPSHTVSVKPSSNALTSESPNAASTCLD